MVVTTLFDDKGEQTGVTIRTLHPTVEDREKHEAMGVVEDGDRPSTTWTNTWRNLQK